MMSDGNNFSREIDLGHGASARADGSRLLVRLPEGYASLSSAVLNGGLRDGTTAATATRFVLNAKVPASYDGVTPGPRDLLRRLAGDGGVDPDATCGLLTAASMGSLSVARREAKGVSASALVTAGTSNARRAGAEADFLGLWEGGDGGDDGPERIPHGTINTVVVVSAPLSDAALVECYAIAVEAKCAACESLGVACGKDPASTAQGTGTDCAVLACPSWRTGRRIEYAGKHTLLAEMVGQAVGEATEAAISKNVEHAYGNFYWYAVCRRARAATFALRGTRPCVPPHPLMPMPGLPASVAAVGACAVVSAYLLPAPGGVRLLLAAFAWDRWLGEPPLAVHPVVIAGGLVKRAVARVPAGALGSPALGLLSGSALLLGMAILFGSGSWTLFAALERASSSSSSGAVLFAIWTVRVLLLKSTFSIQLLCTVSLQMARFLEREQIEEARLQLCWLCSRDSTNLDGEELAGGTLESLAENLSDGFVAPLFWYCCCGPTGALLYRVVNTLDSTIGYRGRFEWFGKPSARLDDVINLIPARITAVLLIIAAGISGSGDVKAGWRVARTDSKLTASPNAGWPMSCLAGLLAVKLEKPKEYALNQAGSRPDGTSIKSGHKVVHLAAVLALALACTAVWRQE